MAVWSADGGARDSPNRPTFVSKPLGLLRRGRLWFPATIVAALFLVGVLSLFILQSLYVWCEAPDPASYAGAQQAGSGSGSIGGMSPSQASVKGVMCIASSHIMRAHTYLVTSAVAGCQDGGTDGVLLEGHRLYSASTTSGVDEQEVANLRSWRSQWERRNLSSALRSQEMEALPDGLTRADMDRFFTADVGVAGPGDQAPSCRRMPGPVWLGVEGSPVACPLMWECRQPGDTPKVLAMCWDPTFFDLNRGMSLPTESMTSSLLTPALGEAKVKLYDQYMGSALFLANVYTNHLAQMFDSNVAYLRGGCWETPFGDKPLLLANVTRTFRHNVSVNLCSNHASSQYHGLIELFSRIVILAPVIRALPAAYILVTDRDLERVSTMFKMVGFPSGLEGLRVQRVRPEELVYSDVAVAAHGPGCGRASRSVWQHVRRELFKIARDSRSMYQRDDAWYVVVAERTRSRGIVEHDALVAGLRAALGVRRVRIFSDRVEWTLESTQELYAGASMFVASHGAGLSNMVFMPYSSSVVEVRPTSFSNRCYHTLADALGFPYYRFDSPGAKMGKLHINVTQVVDLVTSIVQAKGRPVPFYPEVSKRR